jgi:hypothetical protein
MTSRKVLVHRVIQRRDALRKAQDAFDDSVKAAVDGDVAITELAAELGVTNRKWAYASLRRVQSRQAGSDGAQ